MAPARRLVCMGNHYRVRDGNGLPIAGSNCMTATGSESIRNVLSTAGPCITIVSEEAGLAAAIAAVRKELTGSGENPKTLLASVEAESAKVAAENKGRSAIAILAAPGFVRVLPVSTEVKPTAKAADRFDIRTVLAIEASGATFYILALSQKRTRILECTQHSSREISFPAGFPKSLSESKQTDQPDHDLDNRSSAGPDVGGMKGVMFGTTTDREKKDEYLVHYFSAIDKAVNTALKDRTEPLVVAAVESELALYSRVNTYPHLVEPGVHGSPDGMEGGEIHRRALELLQNQPPRELAEFDKKVGTGHASVHIQDIVTAAFEGRVSNLFFQENAKYEGTFDTMRQKVKHSDPDDLIEAAAWQTIVHGGDARIVPASAMPNGVAVCALFRYPASQSTPSTQAAGHRS